MNLGFGIYRLISHSLICACFPILVIRKAGYLLKPVLDLLVAHFSFAYLCALSFIINSEGGVLSGDRVGSFYWIISQLVICARYLFFSHSKGRILTEDWIGFLAHLSFYHLCIFAR